MILAFEFIADALQNLAVNFQVMTLLLRADGCFLASCKIRTPLESGVSVRGLILSL